MFQSRWTRQLVFPLVVLLVTRVVCINSVAAELATGRDFEQRLELPLSGAWEKVPLRRILERISQTQGVALVLDRRIDPSRARSLAIANAPLRRGLADIAEGVSAQISVLPNCVYFGPPVPASSLRTVIELRLQDLATDSLDVPPRRRLQLLNRQTVSWDDLTTPNAALDQIASQFSVPISGRERVPHDLWAGCQLPQVTAIEAVSVVLIQFDLTFEWVGAGEGMRIVPLPQRNVVLREYVLKRPWDEVRHRLIAELPGVELTYDDGTRRLIVVGTLEQQEVVDAFLHPEKARRGSRNTGNGLDRQRFTLRAKNARIVDLMQRLEQSGIRFDYDTDGLQRSRIDLERRINLDLQDVPIEGLLNALFLGQRISYTIRGSVITLAPEQ